jgi:hypothetical protein
VEKLPRTGSLFFPAHPVALWLVEVVGRTCGRRRRPGLGKEVTVWAGLGLKLDGASLADGGASQTCSRRRPILRKEAAAWPRLGWELDGASWADGGASSRSFRRNVPRRPEAHVEELCRAEAKRGDGGSSRNGHGRRSREELSARDRPRGDGDSFLLGL